jgi:SAM-dependent methyltransferase
VTSLAVIWHDVECGAYAADLPLWRELAARSPGPVLELGAGTGRVALELARGGHEVTALDREPELLDELGRRAGALGVQIRCIAADARRLPEQAAFGLVLAPMQFVQIMGGPTARGRLLDGVAALLGPGGRFAAALADLDEALVPDGAAPPLPDVAEHDGFVYSSLPMDLRPDPAGVAIERLRQVVSPTGQLEEERHTLVLEALTPGALESELGERRLAVEPRHVIAATDQHVSSTVVVARSAS